MFGDRFACQPPFLALSVGNGAPSGSVCGLTLRSSALSDQTIHFHGTVHVVSSGLTLFVTHRLAQRVKYNLSSLLFPLSALPQHALEADCEQTVSILKLRLAGVDQI
eukprot:3958106-Alexandrium_andersonii.AAC.1